MSMNAKQALLAEYALIARALAAPARLMLLEQLAQGERGVEALAAKTGLSVANCSQHLQQLRRAGLVTGERRGKAVVYRLTDSGTLQILELIRDVAERNLATAEQIRRQLWDGETPPEPIGRDELEARLAEGTVTILDVRPEDEFAAGHIPGARHVSPARLEEMLAELEGKGGTGGALGEIVAYCRGPYCIYSDQAVRMLRARGLNSRQMRGGLPDWRAEGRAVETGPAGG
ncbi:ArsR family transcriptional regulator [Brevirhabdus pacifica]|uniref:ArsR family transcriptional regulator n=2 Tax=Brevirhabdus pacifica TaxID=1267768 RepID=A0A1U7DGQ7_9RHOB|nr:metalloregulator ArsR/SmtB family transcription factor [Brevirhabdus pacifica]APX89184.1 ArsR family transcriptional regulator [Brevirhabdus pacifica]